MPKRKNKRNARRKEMLFNSYNYKLMGISVALVALGFSLMYWENKVEGFISLFISPILIVAGYALVIYAIMAGDNSGDNSQDVQMKAN